MEYSPLKQAQRYLSKKMSKQQMSVTQALPELKLLEKRIDKVMSSIPDWCKVSTNSAPVEKEKQKKETESALQSFNDLVKRRDAIKRAIILSNAQTKVKIGAFEGTVAEAIEYKTSIRFRRELLDGMKSALQNKREEFERKKAEVDGRLERLLQSELGKDVKTNPETITALTNSFRENNKVELVDPLDLAVKIQSLEDELDSFETNVDWVLSQANATTMIDV
jgi:hypothetical protein